MSAVKHHQVASTQWEWHCSKQAWIPICLASIIIIGHFIANKRCICSFSREVYFKLQYLVHCWAHHDANMTLLQCRCTFATKTLTLWWIMQLLVILLPVHYLSEASIIIWYLPSLFTCCTSDSLHWCPFPTEHTVKGRQKQKESPKPKNRRLGKNQRLMVPNREVARGAWWEEEGRLENERNNK